MRTALETMLQPLMQAEATAHVGADRHEGSEGRTTRRKGPRPKVVTTASDDSLIAEQHATNYTARVDLRPGSAPVLDPVVDPA